METDRHYFIQGLFVIGFSVAAALFFVWLSNSGHRDDVVYRIFFAESVSGLAPGDPVKFRGVDVGTVKSMAIDPADPRLVQVDVKLRKDAPVKTDTKASLKLKGFTGVVTIELSGGSAASQNLAAATPEGQVPQIASEKSSLSTVLDQLPKAIEKFTAIEDQSKKVLSDVGSLTSKIKENPSVLIFPPKEKDKDKDKDKDKAAPSKRAMGDH
jgi:phospholipid/cholesterol/gamma-HCH transport system substrate-binding protein